jgi:hypothetical protein
MRHPNPTQPSIYTRIDLNAYLELQQLAARRGRTLSGHVRHLLTRYVARHAKPKGEQGSSSG